jgi:MFS family permease
MRQRAAELATHAPPSTATEGVDRLASAVLRHGNGLAGRAAASELEAALAQLVPSAQSGTLLHRLLDDGSLDTCFDLDGMPCRVALVSALVGLGYPWALEVSPEDLQLLRRETGRRRFRGLKSRLATALSALASAGWGLLWLMNLGRGASWLHVPFAVGLVHGLAALVVAALASPTRSPAERGRVALGYGVLGWAVLCGPLFSAIAGIALAPGWTNAFWLGMAFASPSMLTAGCCLVAWAVLRPVSFTPGPTSPRRQKLTARPMLG